jgi:nitrate reductase molybdenum cofactor assembly chaperone
MRRWLPGIGRRKPTVPDRELPDDQLRVAWQLVSLLLEYPSVKLFQRLTRLRATAEQLPAAVSEPLVEVIDCLEQQGLEKSRRLYVETFDYTRKCALHLTYYAHGDSRKRGVALVQFKQVYRRAGMELEGEELPDHLSVVLEFGALGDLDVAWDLVNRHRAGVELLAMALEHRNSPWQGALTALRATLPAIDGEQAEAVAKLLRDGPESEEVGLEPYGIDPFLNPRPDDDAELLGV